MPTASFQPHEEELLNMPMIRSMPPSSRKSPKMRARNNSVALGVMNSKIPKILANIPSNRRSHRGKSRPPSSHSSALLPTPVLAASALTSSYDTMNCCAQSTARAKGLLGRLILSALRQTFSPLLLSACKICDRPDDRRICVSSLSVP